MSKEMEFFIFLIESYAEYKDTTADEVLRLWDKLKLTNFIYEMYERYHIERIENAFEDIDKLIDGLNVETPKISLGTKPPGENSDAHFADEFSPLYGG